MLPEADEIDAEAIGQHSLLDHVTDDMGLRRGLVVARLGHVAEGVEPEFDLHVRLP